MRRKNKRRKNPPKSSEEGVSPPSIYGINKVSVHPVVGRQFRMKRRSQPMALPGSNNMTINGREYAAMIIQHLFYIWRPDKCHGHAVAYPEPRLLFSSFSAFSHQQFYLLFVDAYHRLAQIF